MRDLATGYVVLMVTVHVDDLEVTGKPLELLRFKRHLEARFGALKEQRHVFIHCGLRYEQCLNDGWATMDQQKFITDLPYAKVMEKKHVAEKPLCTAGHKEYRSGAGGCGWSLKTRLEEGFAVSEVQSRAHAPDLE